MHPYIQASVIGRALSEDMALLTQTRDTESVAISIAPMQGQDPLLPESTLLCIDVNPLYLIRMLSGHAF